MDKHDEKLFQMTRDALAYVGDFYNDLFLGKVAHDVNILERAKGMYQKWWRELQGIEAQMSSYAHTETEYQSLCERYKNGYRILLTKVYKTMKQKGEINGKH